MSDSAPLIDTFGWHTVAAVTYTEVNRAIAASSDQKIPKSFSQIASDQSATATGNFSGWKLTTGGSGAKISMALTVSGGKLTKGTTSQTLKDSQISMNVEAGFIPQPDTTIVQLSLQADKDVTITTNAQSFSQSSGLNFSDASIYLSLLRDWLASNMNLFNHVFAAVDLSPKLDNTPGLTWLKPSWYSYAVAEPAGAKLDNSVFAVLCLVDGAQPPSNLVQQVSSSAIPSGQKAAFLLAPGKFLQHLMLPAVPLMFSDLKISDADANFKIDSNGTRIISTNDLTLLPLSLENSKQVKPTVSAGNFSVTIDSTDLQITISDMQFNYSPGIDVHLTYNSTASIGYDEGKQILTMTILSQSASSPNAQTQPWLNDLNIALGVIGAVAGLLAGVGGAVASATPAANAAEAGVEMTQAGSDAATATATAAQLAQDVNQGTTLAARVTTFLKVAAFVGVGGAVGALPAAVTGVLQAIANNDYNSLPKVTDLTNAAIGKVVKWPAAVGDYKLKIAQLNMALQFGLS